MQSHLQDELKLSSLSTACKFPEPFINRLKPEGARYS